MNDSGFKPEGYRDGFTVHRFHDFVAVYLRGNETVYLSEYTARTLGAALERYADDVRWRGFTEPGSLGTFEHGLPE